MTVARELVASKSVEAKRIASPERQCHPLLNLLSDLDRYIARRVKKMIEPPSAKVLRRLREDTETHLDLIMFGEAAARAVRTGQLKPREFTYRKYLAGLRAK